MVAKILSELFATIVTDTVRQETGNCENGIRTQSRPDLNLRFVSRVSTTAQHACALTTRFGSDYMFKNIFALLKNK